MCNVTIVVLIRIFMDGCMREMKSKVVNAGAKLRLNDGYREITITGDLRGLSISGEKIACLNATLIASIPKVRCWLT